MSLSGTDSLHIVLWEGRDAEALAPEDRFAIASALLEKGYSIICATGKGDALSFGRSPTLVLGRFNEGQPHPFPQPHQGGMTLVEHLPSHNAAAVLELAEAACAKLQVERPGRWQPWFPVIDFDRCTHCMQCLSFCLFSVFGVTVDRQITVQNPENCKTNCPACSRVCPEAAIVFPKYGASPINGDEVCAAGLQNEKVKVDISALLGGDVYGLLRDRAQRAQSRFSKERDPEAALRERRGCLAELAASMDIPPEVLMALPSQDEIQRKMKEAIAKAQAVREKKTS